LHIFRAAERDEQMEEGKKKKGGVAIPEYWPWKEAKKVFRKPDVTPADEIEVRHPLEKCMIDAELRPLNQLEWKSPDVDGLVEFLVKDKGFKCVLMVLYGLNLNNWCLLF